MVEKIVEKRIMVEEITEKNREIEIDIVYNIVIQLRQVKKDREMPKGFDNCVKRGGRVRTKTLSEGRYIHICFLDGKSYAGHVKKKIKDHIKKGRS